MDDDALRFWITLQDQPGLVSSILTPPRADTMLEAAAFRFGNKTHMVYRDLSITYKESFVLAKRLSAGLHGLGIQPGDRVGLCMPNHPVYPIIVSALWRLGAVGVGMNALYPSTMLQSLASDADVRAIVTLDDPDLRAKVAAVCEPLGAMVITFRADAADLSVLPRSELRQTEDAFSGEVLLSSGDLDQSLAVNPKRDLAMLQFTGGTTGQPKGVMITHANISKGMQQLRAAFSEMKAGEEVALASFTLTHIAGLSSTVLFMTAMAAKIVLVNRFRPADALEIVPKHRITYFPAAPPMLIGLLDLPASKSCDWSSLRHMNIGTAPTPIEVARSFQEMTGVAVRNGFGQTESTAGYTMETSTGSGKNTSVGLAYAETRISIRATDDPSRELAVGEIGEICAAGPQVTAGYWRNDTATKEAFVGDYIRTGDLGYLADDGRLYVVDRMKDVIIASGYKVYPTLVEHAVHEHPDVKQAAVIGIPDKYRGETVKVYVVLKPGKTLTHSELQHFLRDRLSPMEIPKVFELREFLPLTAVGKVSRRELAKQLDATDASAK